jgi:hypothetical protein
MSFDEDGDPAFQKYRQFVDHGVPFFKKYPIKAEITIDKKVNDIEFRTAISSLARIDLLKEIYKSI